MKLYDCAPAPSPRRARVFIAEKGLNIPIQQVNLSEGEQFSDWFKEKNPACTVPVLELDDGACLTETMAICRYLEELHPEPALMGRTPIERARITTWNRRVEQDGYMAIAESFRNKAKGFRGRAVTGDIQVDQIPALIERGRQRALAFFDVLDQRLADREFMMGDEYTLVDISALICVDFASWIKLEPGDDRAHLKRWHEAVSARPSASA